jgi:pimeloyl-ACP methyl ester carboxylesterase
MYEQDEIYDVHEKRMVPNPERQRYLKEERRRNRRRFSGCRGCLSRLVYITILLLMIIVTPIVLGFAYDKVQSGNENFQPPGQLIQVMGNEMHVYCTGEGSPTVVLDAGPGNWSIHWSAVQPKIAEVTRVCSFDRPGYGWSEAADDPPTVVQTTFELSSALSEMGEPGPYVMVAHSTSAATARFFAHSFPGRVAGMVLVDPLNEDQFGGLVDHMSRDLDIMKAAEFLAPIRMLRMLDRFYHYDDKALEGAVLPGDAARIYRAGYYDQVFWTTVLAEYDALETSANLMEAVGNLGDMPLVVLAISNRPADAWPPDSTYQQMQLDFASLSTDSEIVYSESGVSHVHIENPTLVTVSVQVVVDKVRTRLGMQ